MIQSVINTLDPSYYSYEWIRNNIIPLPNQDYTSAICDICKQIAINPCECDQCECLFCENCIFDVLLKQSCFGDCQGFVKKRAHKTIRNLISKLQVKCINKDFGCLKELQLQQLELHRQSSCEFTKIECKNKGLGCNHIACKRNIKEHEEDCDYNQQICQKCKVGYLKNEQHSCVEYIFKKLQKLESLQQNLIEKLMLISQDEQIIYKLSNKFDEIQEKLDTKNQLIHSLCQREKKCFCEKGHELQWGNVESKNCKGCNQKRSIRFTCIKCGVNYCLNCKRIYLGDLICPANHGLKICTQQSLEKEKLSRICDVCYRDIGQIGGVFYTEKECDLDICNICFSLMI